MPIKPEGALPPAPRAKGIILRVTTAETQQFVCLSSTVWGQLQHWHGNRSHECKGDKARCEGCSRGWAGRWKGYLHVQTGQHGADTWLELTAQAWSLLESQLPDGETARGVIFRLRKTKGGAKGRYLCEVLERRVSNDELPQAKDVKPLLSFLFSCKRPSGQEPE
jgi:hypothetical protein